MSNYLAARDKLSEARLLVMPDGPEWIKINAAIAELDRAESAEIEAEFVNASRSIDDAIAKLQAIITGITPNTTSEVLDRVNGALSDLIPVAENVEALLSGEPASALPDMEATNIVTMASETATAGTETEAPPPATPIPPVRERSRSSASAMAALAPTSKTPKEMIENILVREGGFVNHPADRGGATNFGVTQRTLESWRGQDVSVEDVKSMTIDEAREIYQANYYLRPKIDQLPELIQPLIFDMSINHGPGTAIKLLQRSLNDSDNPCPVDGGIGNKTITCTNTAVDSLGDELINKVVERRIAFYHDIVERDASQQVFLKGWLRRANEFLIA